MLSEVKRSREFLLHMYSSLNANDDTNYVRYLICKHSETPYRCYNIAKTRRQLVLVSYVYTESVRSSFWFVKCVGRDKPVPIQICCI